MGPESFWNIRHSNVQLISHEQGLYYTSLTLFTSRLIRYFSTRRCDVIYCCSSQDNDVLCYLQLVGWSQMIALQKQYFVQCTPCNAQWRNNSGHTMLLCNASSLLPGCHVDVIKWKHFPRYWPFVRGIHRSRWTPRTKARDAELWCFLGSAPEWTIQ